jgi:translation elongation factor P/translation initiation factor 5A
MGTRRGKAGELKAGGYVMLDGEPWEVIKVEKVQSTIGVEKVRAEIKCLLRKEEKILEVFSTEELEYPILELKPAQILSIGEKVTLFDLRNRSTVLVDVPEDEGLKRSLAVNAEVEYAEIAGVKRIVQVGLYDAHSYT